jgi:carboxylesterase type B
MRERSVMATRSLLAAMVLGAVAVAQTVKPVRVESGLPQGTGEDGVTIYRGIPYAAAPIGDLRWRAPQPPPRWDGIRVVTEYGRACMQTNAAIVFRHLREHNRPAPTSRDEALSEMMRTYWTNFAKTGDPNGAGVPKWPAFTNGAPQMLHIEYDKTKAVPIVSENGLKVLDEYFAWRRSMSAPASTARR